MKAPFYVLDRSRKLVFGQFFKQESADEVAAILKHYSIDGYFEVFGGDDYRVSIMEGQLSRKEIRKGTEADLVRISSIKYFPKPDIRWALFKGAVVTIGGSDQFVVVALETSGRKWNTFTLRGLVDGKPYKYKVQMWQDGKAKFVRMATPNEYHGARQQREQIAAKRQARVETNRAKVDTLDVQPGDVVTVNYSDVGHKTEVVEDVNWKDGRVAIRRRGMAALVREKRRFIPAKCIVKIVEKGPGHYRPNSPLYAKYGFGNAPSEAQLKEAADIKLLNQLASALR